MSLTYMTGSNQDGWVGRWMDNRDYDRDSDEGDLNFQLLELTQYDCYHVGGI